MDREAWRSTVLGIVRVGHDLVTKPPSKYQWASQMALVVKNPIASAGDTGSIPGWERSPGERNGNPLQ